MTAKQPAGNQGRDARMRAPIMSLVELAAESLREDVLSGVLKPGERILLDAVASALGMSNIPVREALRTLATEGLVVAVPNRGYVVVAATVDDLDETYRLRMMLEPLAVRLAVPRLTDTDIDHLEAQLRILNEAFGRGEWDTYRVHHRDLHFSIYERSNSPWLVRLTEMLWLNSQRYQRMTTRISGELEERAKEHRNILDACRRGAADDAADLTHDHLFRAKDKIRAFLMEHEMLGAPSEVREPHRRVPAAPTHEAGRL
jgi:DNA-binding GntR family transcriptional regulator